MAMQARITTVEGDAGKIDDAVKIINDKIIPALKGVQGFTAVNFLADRSAGKLVAVAFYADEAALEGSGEAVGTMRVVSLSARALAISRNPSGWNSETTAAISSWSSGEASEKNSTGTHRATNSSGGSEDSRSHLARRCAATSSPSDPFHPA